MGSAYPNGQASQALRSNVLWESMDPVGRGAQVWLNGIFGWNKCLGDGLRMKDD